MIYHAFFNETEYTMKERRGDDVKRREKKSGDDDFWVQPACLPAHHQSSSYHAIHYTRLYRFDLCMHLSWQKTTKQLKMIWSYAGTVGVSIKGECIRWWRWWWRDIASNNKTITHSFAWCCFFINSISNKMLTSSSLPGKSRKVLCTNRKAGNVFNVFR